MSTRAKPSARARLVRFAARLGVDEPDTLDLGVLARFRKSDLVAAAQAAGLKVGPALDRADLLKQLTGDLERDERRQSGRRSKTGATRRRAVKITRRPQARAPEAQAQIEVVPWGYGIDRVRAMPVDPERLFAYWEITDEALERARADLGDENSDASLILRVHDTTGRLFDGTNAHHHFDHEIARDDRQWFFQINRPGSEACVEVGLRAGDGRFARIARSGRVEFPRRGPGASSPPQWLTVRVRDGGTETATVPAGERSEGAGAPGPGAGAPAPRGGTVSDPGEPGLPEETGFELAPGDETTETMERISEQSRVIRWEESDTSSSWEEGPLDHEVESPAPLTERFVGGMRVHRTEAETRVVYGPWEVVIRGLRPYRRRSVLARWEMHRSWISEEGDESSIRLPVEGNLMAGSSATLGWRVGSELRLGGASELLYRGASERRLGGASERLYRGASDRVMRGASERLYRGASERRGGKGEPSGRDPEPTYPRVPDDAGSD